MFEFEINSQKKNATCLLLIYKAYLNLCSCTHIEIIVKIRFGSMVARWILRKKIIQFHENSLEIERMKQTFTIQGIFIGS